MDDSMFYSVTNWEKMGLVFTEMDNVAGKRGFGEKIRNQVLDVIILKCY